jgi:hypothetical protein
VFVKSDVLPAFITGQKATYQLQAGGGTPPYKWTNLTGCGTNGVSEAGLLTATGVTLGSGSSISISTPCEITVTDTRGQSAKFTFRITTVAAAPSITTQGATMETGKQAAVTIATAAGGTQPYFFYKGTGAFPPIGTSVINSADRLSGVLSGTPAKAGNYTFDVCVADLSRSEKCASVTVVVTDPPRLNVTWTTSGTGTGTISPPTGADSLGNAVAGVACSPAASNCLAFPPGTRLTFATATPGSGSKFDGWNGAGCTGTGSCVVVLSATTNVPAVFTLNQTQTGGSLTGTWTGTWTRTNVFGFCDFQRYNFTLNLVQSGSTVTGNFRAQITAISPADFGCPGRVGDITTESIVTSSVSGSAFTLNTGSFIFTGTVSGNTLAGSGRSSGSSITGPFSVTKQ